MEYLYLIDQDSSINLNEDLMRCIGIEQSILMIKIHGWQRFNQRAEKSAYKRHDLYWMPARGRDLSGNGIGNINYIKGASRKIAGLVDLGLLSEHLETPKGKSMHHRWVRVNESAFNKFIELWMKSGKPNSQGTGKKAKQAYKKFITQWNLVKSEYIQTFGKSKPDEKQPEPEIDEKEVERNKQIADYIKTWMDYQKAKPAKTRNEYVIKYNRTVMESLIDKGVTQQQLRDFMSVKSNPDFYVSMMYLNNNIIGWINSQKNKATGTKSTGLQPEIKQPESTDHEVESAVKELGEMFS